MTTSRWSNSKCLSDFGVRSCEVRFTSMSRHRQATSAGPKSANSGLMRRRRVLLFDHLVDIGELLGQPRFAKTLDHRIRIF